MPVMAERIRITFDAPERVRRALNIRAARTGISVGQIVEQLVEELMAEDLALADEALNAGDDSGRNKRGRPSKS